ncbi:Nn.00g002260.m01.CDS01 [Neocucurbitaria sp. VM-36]
MSRLSLEDFDKHIEALRAQLQFLNETLEATDHNAPDWLATDLISLRNKSGRLQDDMKRFRDQLDSEGLTEKRAKISNKRLSIEGSKASTSTPKSHPPSSKNQAISPPLEQSPTPRSKPVSVEETYVVQHIDVTEEVNRRLQASRLRRLMETPSTSQKRKYNAYEEPRSGGAAELEDDGSRGGYSGSEYERTPTKRLKSSGAFEQVGKRKENDNRRPDEEERLENRADFKRRKL